ncbi:MAG: NADH:flavin oxidoreductase/NADH oxidase family protein [Paracoccaceae bacterium]|jgi:2,4-dienoyl-CoA reductase-like NADH-dependent reductase (Old Yellow Enzyme family)|nr:NADH:flavin oxidoreductase/NADH oxidase family protein [Paracoccaceae bacterium]
MKTPSAIFDPLTLPCGTVLKNRIVKSAMSDSLGDGTGHPSSDQVRLYQRWARGGLAASIVGEVQCSPDYAEKPGNLVLNSNADLSRFHALANAGAENDGQLWLQLGHAGALAFTPISDAKGPSALDLPGLTCAALTPEEIAQTPTLFASTALLAKQNGFGGVQIHAAHGFLLSQFLSPLFNKRDDAYGGSIENRMRLLLESIEAVRNAVGAEFPIAIKLNSSDQLEGGFAEEDSLRVVAALNDTSVDLIDISGGTYFPGAKAATDGAGEGPYFLEFAIRARAKTSKPLMLTGGFKSRQQVEDVLASGFVDVVGLARLMALEPSLPNLWHTNQSPSPAFPRFATTPVGGITAWYTMQLTALAEEGEISEIGDLETAIIDYEARDRERTETWLKHFTK